MQASSSTKKRFATRLILVGVSLFVAFLCVELFTRTFLRAKWDTATLAAKSARIDIRSLIMLDDDKELLYRLRPNLDATFQGSRVLTSASGSRIGATNVQPTAQSLRIALVGDSSPFGWRVDYAETYGELTRKKLEQSSGAPVVLENFSVPGYNAGQEEELLKTRILAFHPDLLIVHHDHNDSQPTGWGYGSWVPPEYGDNALHSAALKILLRKLRTRAGPETRVSADPSDEVLNGYCVAGPSYEAMMESRRRLVQTASANGIPVLIILFNADIKADASYGSSPTYLRLHKALRTRLEEMGYLVLDPFPLYQDWMKEQQLPDMAPLWSDAEDHHPNPRGHALLADFVVRYIQSTPRLAELVTKKR